MIAENGRGGPVKGVEGPRPGRTKEMAGGGNGVESVGGRETRVQGR